MSKLQHLPITFFAATMGLTGLALAWRRAGIVLGADASIALALTVLAATVFALTLLAYAVKAARFPQAVRGEFGHPIRFPFFATLTVSPLLLAAALASLAPALASVLWWTGALAHLALTGLALKRWLAGVPLAQVLPTWLVPLVGNIVAPLAGTQVGSPGLSWFMYALGLTLWIALVPVILGRHLLHGTPQPPALAPAVTILVAPPAVALLSLEALAPQAAVGPLGYVILGSAWAFLVVAASQAAILARTPFGLPWWATTFPLAALSAATISMVPQLPDLRVAAWVVLGAVSLAIAAIFVLTLVALLRGRLLVPDPAPR